MIDVVFYFDFASPSAYLLAMQLGEWSAGLPVRLRPYPVEGGVVVALSGEPAVRHAEVGQRYQRTDAERWATRLGVELRWTEEVLRSGLALRVCVVLQESHPALVWPMVRGTFAKTWGGLGGLSESQLRSSLLALQLGEEAVDHVLKGAESAEVFEVLEDQTRHAVRLGLFEVPALRVGEGLFVGHDRLVLVGEAVMEEVLVGADGERLRRQLGVLLLELGEERRRKFLEQVVPVVVMDGEAQAMAALRAAEEGEEHRLQVALESLAHLLSSYGAQDVEQVEVGVPVNGLNVGLLVSRRDVPIHMISTLLQGMGGNEGVVLLAPASVLVAYDVGVPLGPWGGPGGLIARAQTPQSQSRSLVCEMGEAAAVLSQDPSEGGDLAVGRLAGGWGGCVLDGDRAMDQVFYKAAAVGGAHVIVLYGVDEVDPRPVAAARALRCWVLACDESTVRLCDGQGRWLEWPLRGGLEGGLPTLHLAWPPVLSGGSAVREWESPEARAVLLNELPVSLGAVGSEAELILACRGHSLRLETANIRSTLSPGRPFEVIRLGAVPLVVLPFFGEQLRAYDLVAERLMRALCRAPHDGVLLIVSYWPDAEVGAVEGFELDIAAAAVAHQVPVAVVIGERVADLWHPEQEEPSAYRIEPEGEQFQFNATLQPSMKARQKQMIAHLGAAPQRYLNMLGGCAAHPQQADISRLTPQ